MLLNDDIADIGKPDGIWLPAFVVDEFLEVSSEGISTIQKSFFYILFYIIQVCFFSSKCKKTIQAI